MNFSTKPERLAFYFFCFISLFVVITLRRPDIIMNAQPWAEDGRVWIQNIYNDGFWNSFYSPQNGYYQTISRIAFGIGLLFGLSKAALIANTIAISIRCFFVLYILSSRMSFIDIRLRIFSILYFLFMPNVQEGYVNITNAHWYLSMYLMAVVISDEAKNKIWKIHDYLLLVISSLSGPFVVFIAPCLFLKRIIQRGGIIKAVKQINLFDALMIVLFTIQFIAILSSSDAGRSHAPLGASFGVLVNIISYRVFWGTFLSDSISYPLSLIYWLNLIIFCFMVTSILYSFVVSGWRLKCSILFVLLMIAFALAKPMISMTQPQWPCLLNPNAGERYFYITNFGFFCFILSILNRNHVAKVVITYALFALMIPLFFISFSVQPNADTGYLNDIKKFNALPRGETMSININPPGWTMQLIKK